MSNETHLLRLRAQANIESLAVQCLTGAVIALSRDANLMADFDYSKAGTLAVDLATAIRRRVITVTKEMTDEEIATVATDFAAGKYTH